MVSLAVTKNPPLAQNAESFGQEFPGKLRILYGGSVKPGNAHGLMSEEEIDGAQVVGASLDPKSFAAIVKYWELSRLACTTRRKHENMCH